MATDIGIWIESPGLTPQQVCEALRQGGGILLGGTEVQVDSARLHVVDDEEDDVWISLCNWNEEGGIEGLDQAFSVLEQSTPWGLYSAYGALTADSDPAWPHNRERLPLGTAAKSIPA